MTDERAQGPEESPPEPETEAVTQPQPVQPKPAQPIAEPDGVEVVDEPTPAQPEGARPEQARRKMISGAGVLIGVLLALLGFTIVVQLRSNATDSTYASAREVDLVQIMSDLDSTERRLSQNIVSLEQTKQDLLDNATAGAAALEEAKARADALGILAGTLKAQGPGVVLRFFDDSGKVKAGTLLNAVQELRGAGAEALQIEGGSGGAVRIVASTSFVDEPGGGVRVDGKLLTGPYTLRAIGDPADMGPALQIHGGVVAAVNKDGGNVIVTPMEVVEINEIRSTPTMEHAKPVR